MHTAEDGAALAAERAGARIVIAPDKFKGSLSAPEVAAALERGIRSVDATIVVDLVPMADGGEGTLDAAIAAGFTKRVATVSGPTGKMLDAPFAVRGTQAVIEMATASGLDVLPQGVRAPLTASSRGTGELIKCALDAGCTDIVLGVGGSACTDGGAGLIAGLGARMLDEHGNELPDGGAALTRLARIDLSGLDPRVVDLTVTLASDVDNPLLGIRGAAAVFSPQKGASDDDVEVLERGLARFVDVLTLELGARAAVADAAGAGAAGGVGYASLAVLGAHRQPGIDVVLGFTALHDRVAGAALVITGEGSLDEQSLGGKTPVGVARAARTAAVPVIAVCGRTTLTPATLASAGFVRTYALTDEEPDLELCIRTAGALLERIGARIAREHRGYASFDSNDEGVPHDRTH